MKIVLTGASGFLGSALARRWAADGHQVTALIRPMSTLHRLATLVDRIVVVPIHDEAALVDVVTETQPEVIVHTACAYGRQNEPPLTVFDVNLRLGLLLLEAARRSRTPVSLINTGTVLQPEVSLYALSKRQFSEWGARVAAATDGQTRFVDVRLQHMYGPGDDPSKFTTHVIRACRRNDPALPLTAGEQCRDFVHIDDTVAAYTTILENLDRFATTDAIDVGSGVAPPVRAFVETVHRLTRSTTRLDFGALPYRANEAMLCRADTQRLTSLGWAPAYDLNTGIRRVLDAEETTLCDS